MNIDTKCIHSGYRAKDGEPIVMPICQSTTYRYESSDKLAELFDLSKEGHIYSRISNPTLEFVEKKIAALEGGTGAVLCSSGQSAILLAILNICSAGDHIVCSSALYGGTMNLFNVTMKKMGISVSYTDPLASESEIEELITDKTKAIYGETLSNPTLVVFDFNKFSKIAKKHGIALIIDNTFPTPILCRPFEHGADVIIHSTSKYFDGHATVLGGVIIESGKFNWANGKYTEFTEPDRSYHGVVYTKDFKDCPYITKARVQYLRDTGAVLSPFQAFILNMGMETLHLRMERHSQNALAVAKYLENHPQVEWVNYPMLESNKQKELVKMYLPKGGSGVLSFGLKGGKQAGVKFMDSLKLASIVTHVSDVRTCVLHPASTTHRQLSEEQLVESGVQPELIRLSIGIEDINDIIEDIEQAITS